MSGANLKLHSKSNQSRLVYGAVYLGIEVTTLLQNLLPSLSSLKIETVISPNKTAITGARASDLKIQVT
jgi:hypothetical protein